MEHRTDIITHVDIRDVDGHDLVSGVGVESALQDGLGNTVRILQHNLVALGGTNGGDNAFADAGDDRLFLGATDETIEVSTNGHARLYFYLNAILGDRIDGGATARRIRHIDNLRADGSEDRLKDRFIRSAGGDIDGTGTIPIKVKAGFLRGDECLHRLHDVAAREVMGVNLFDFDDQAGLGRGNLSIDNHRVGHAAQAHADEVEKPDLSPSEPGPHPNREEGEQEEHEQEQGACCNEDNNISHLFGHGKNLADTADGDAASSGLGDDDGGAAIDKAIERESFDQDPFDLNRAGRGKGRRSHRGFAHIDSISSRSRHC